MYVPPEWKRRLWIATAVAPFLLPGWAGELVPVPRQEILLDSARYDADDVFGVGREGEAEGEQWHLQYMGSRPASFFWMLNLKVFATRVVPPRYAAHIPPRSDFVAERADAYFRVVTHTRWPWWWPGGGVDFRVTGR